MQLHKFITQSDNTFGRLYDFLSSNPLKVKNVVGDFLAKENWKKIKDWEEACQQISILKDLLTQRDLVSK